MNRSKAIVALCLATAALALAYALVGLLSGGAEPGPVFTAVTGERVALHGGGLYEYDSLSHGAGFRGTDLVTVAVALPLLLVAVVLYSRGSLRGAFLLLGSVTYALYNSFSLATGAMYNPLFLVYVATVAVSLSAFVALYRELSSGAASSWVISDGAPCVAAGVFLLITGAVTTLLWLLDLVPALLSPDVPVALGHYTTVVTYVLDLGIILPAILATGVGMLRRRPESLPAAIALIGLIVLIGFVVVGQTFFQRAAGIHYSAAQFAGFIGSWVILGVIALFVLVGLLRSVSPASDEATG